LESWELMKIKGIPLKVHPSWFFILFLFTWTAQGQLVNVVDRPLSPLMSWLLGLLTALLLFASVVLHELGHSLVALREGVKVESITLFFLGGIARVEKECSTPMGTLRVAVAGPLVSIILGFILLRLAGFASEVYPVFSILLGQLGLLNLVLAIFNLIPGLPLDGGVILKALVWQLTGSQDKGVKVASSSGRLLALLAIFLGFWISFKGGGFNGLWLIMLGWIGLSASRSQNQLLTFQKILQELRVKDVNNRRYRVLEADQTLLALSKLRLSLNDERRGNDWILVCDSGRWIGYVSDKPLQELPVQYWDKHYISDHVQPLSDLPSIGEKAPLWKAVLELEKSSGGRLLIMNLAGLPSGTMDKVDLGEAVLKRLGLENIPKTFLESARKQNNYPLGISLPNVVASMLATGKIKIKG